MNTEKITEAIQLMATLIAEKLREVLTDSQQRENTPVREVWLTTEQVCEQLHITKSTLYRHRRDGYIVPDKYIGRKPLFSRKTIDNYLNNFEQE